MTKEVRFEVTGETTEEDRKYISKLAKEEAEKQGADKAVIHYRVIEEVTEE